MDKKAAKRIVEAAEVIGLEVRHDEAYSGRGMYGSTTDAIVTESLCDLLQCVAYAAGELRDEENSDTEIDENEYQTLDDFIRDLAPIRTDNMGRSATVYY